MNKSKKIIIAVLLVILVIIIVLEGMFFLGVFESKPKKNNSSNKEVVYNEVSLNGYTFSISNDNSYRILENKYIAYENEKLGYYAYLYPVSDAFSEDNYNLLKTTLKNNGFINSDEFIYEIGDKTYDVIEGSIKGTDTYVIYGTLQENSIIAYLVIEDGDIVDDVYDAFYDIVARANMVETPNISIQNMIVPNNLYNPIK